MRRCCRSPERSNIGVGTIYRYFSNKKDLINVLYIDVKTRLTRYALRNYSEDKPVEENFKQSLCLNCGKCEEHCS